MNDPKHIDNWRRYNARLTISGQPTENQLIDIQKLGVSYVINLGMNTHERALPDEAASTTKLGMNYIYIPVDFDNPKETDFEQFVKTFSALDKAVVHVHCIANLRVTAFFYRYHQDVLGNDETKAFKIMDTVWRPGGVWAKFIGDESSVKLPHSRKSS